MLPFILAAALATVSPASCPSDLLVANPRLKIVRARDKAFDNYIVTIDIKDRGALAQPDGTRQHLELLQNGSVRGTQPIPVLGADEDYAAAFRIRLPHKSKRDPFPVEFRFVLDSKNGSRANCTSANDRVSATL